MATTIPVMLLSQVTYGSACVPQKSIAVAFRENEDDKIIAVQHALFHVYEDYKCFANAREFGMSDYACADLHGIVFG